MRHGLNEYFTGKQCKRGHIANRNLHRECLECKKERYKEWASQNREARNLSVARWRKRNPLTVRHHSAKHKARKRQATVSWADSSAIETIYKNCPNGFQVDHIFPVNSDWVCGLHLPCNLQYLPGSENQTKLNLRTGEHERYEKHIIPSSAFSPL